MREPQDKMAKLRRLGRWKFVLFYGVCGWGLLCAVIFIFLILLQHRSNPTVLLTPAYLRQLLAVIGLFLFGGCLWGLFMWRSMNRAK